MKTVFQLHVHRYVGRERRPCATIEWVNINEWGMGKWQMRLVTHSFVSIIYELPLVKG